MDFVIKDGVLSKYMGTGGAVVIPLGVTEIGVRAFAGRDDVISVEIPESVLVIDKWSFAECTALKHVCLGGCASVGEGAFYRCVELCSLEAPGGVETIGTSAFFGCAKLTSPTLNAVRFELPTYRDATAVAQSAYPDEDALTTVSYSWEDYKRITAELQEYALIFVTEEYDCIVGADEPLVMEVNQPIADKMIAVADGRFAGCLLEDSFTCYVSGKMVERRSYVLLCLEDKPKRVQYMDGSHCASDAYSRVTACFRRRGNSFGWVGIVGTGRKIISDS